MKKEIVVDALKALMSRSLDYAGLFPPAKLPLNEAIAEFAAIRNDPNSWFLVRFVLPAVRSGDFAQEARAQLAEACTDHNPWHITTLLRTGPSITDALELLRSESLLLRGLLDSHSGAVVVDSCEVPLPEEVINSHDQELARSFLNEAYKILDDLQLKMPIYWEVNLNKSFEHVAFAAHHLNLSEAGRACLKFRTGGLTASAVVSAEVLAHAFWLAQQQRVPFKLTAGLHLAMRHFDPAVGTNVFGFLNVFSAAVLGWTHQLSETELKLLLEEKSANALEFSSEGLAWKNYKASITDIRNVRSIGLKSFGSCSFYEPIADLKNLKLIP